MNKRSSGARRTCLRACVAILEYADNTEHELREKLSKRGYPPEEIDAAITIVKEKRLFSEESYALRYAATAAKKGYGPRRILLSMREKGFREDCLEAVKNIMDSSMKGVAAQSDMSPAFTGDFSAKNLSSKNLSSEAGISPGFVNSDIENLLFSLDFISTCAILITKTIQSRTYKHLRARYEEGCLPESREERVALKKEKQRLYAALFRRGFDLSTIRDAEELVREELSAEE